MGENKRKLVKKEDWLAVLFVVLGLLFFCSSRYFQKRIESAESA